MKVSIITPSLNSEKYIEDNLKSVHLQQNGDFSVEQIIVDGHSNDNTVDIIKSFQQKYNADIKIIQAKDKNMYDAINKGLNAITGDIWACLNTDDYYYPHAITSVVNEFSKNPGVDVVYGLIDIIDDNGVFLNTRYLPQFNLYDLILQKQCYIIKQPSSFLRKTVLDKVGTFDINYNYASDYDYFIRVGLECKLKLVGESFTLFRQHLNSISYNSNSQIILWKESADISEKYAAQLEISRNLFFYLNYLKFYIIQLKTKNLKYLISKILKSIKY